MIAIARIIYSYRPCCYHNYPLASHALHLGCSAVGERGGGGSPAASLPLLMLWGERVGGADGPLRGEAALRLRCSSGVAEGEASGVAAAEVLGSDPYLFNSYLMSR